jgi:hypothetical protein
LVVNADECCRARDGTGEESGSSFLHSVQFSIEDLSPIAEVAASFFDSVELLVPNIEDYPPTSGRPTVKLRAISVYDDGVVRERVDPLSVQLLWRCCFVRVR